MAKRSERVFALLLAGLFLVTSVGFSVYVIWQIQQENKNSAVQKGLQEALAKQNQNNTKKPEKGKKMEGFTPSSTPVTALAKTDLKEGTGKVAEASSTVTVVYTGALVSDGTIFDTNVGSQPTPFELSSLIKGWQEGIPGMKVGGKRRLLIPYAMAYGEEGRPPTIPPKSDLVFDIELQDVK